MNFMAEVLLILTIGGFLSGFLYEVGRGIMRRIREKQNG